MKQKTISLCALASVSTALILPAFSEDVFEKSVEPKVEIEAKVEENYHIAVEEQVLRYLNSKVPLLERFSRVLAQCPARTTPLRSSARARTV